LERAVPALPVKPGKVARREFESVRHGTQTVIAAFDAATGQVTASVGETRTEHDYANFLDTLFAAGAPTTKWRVIADNLNTHVSESVVRPGRPLVRYRGRPRRIGQVGVLAARATREAFCATSHRISFHFHPQTRFLAQPDRDLVPNSRAQTLRRGSFISKQHLKARIEAFIAYFNRTLAKPFKWTMTSKPLAASTSSTRSARFGADRLGPVDIHLRARKAATR
jgi:hypothetical protein